VVVCPATSAQPQVRTADALVFLVAAARAALLPWTYDVDRAKRFYEGLGWRCAADIARGENFRAVQLTPPHSACSIAFGKGLTTGEPGSVKRLLLAVDDIDAAREDLSRCGVEVSEVFHLDGGVYRARIRKVAPTRVMPPSAIRMATSGCCRRSRRGFRAGSGMTDDGRRFPGKPTPRNGRASRPLRASHAAHNWWDWYAAYMDAREQGSTADEASAAAGHYMEEVLQIAAL
jgi:hypothetical protein